MQYTFEQHKKELFARNPEVKELYLKETLKYFISVELRKARLKKGVSQIELAKKAHTTQSVVARIEAGNGNISLKTLGKFLDVLGMKLKVVKK